MWNRGKLLYILFLFPSCLFFLFDTHCAVIVSFHYLIVSYLISIFDLQIANLTVCIVSVLKPVVVLCFTFERSQKPLCQTMAHLSAHREMKINKLQNFIR